MLQITFTIFICFRTGSSSEKPPTKKANHIKPKNRLSLTVTLSIANLRREYSLNGLKTLNTENKTIKPKISNLIVKGKTTVIVRNETNGLYEHM